jgi:hypothetical protein
MAPVRMAAAVAALLAAWPFLADAHALFLYATAEGAIIRGEAVSLPADPVPDARIRVLGPGDSLLGDTTTGSDGAFAFEARRRCDHRLVLMTADGHRATFTVPAEELPAELPALDGDVVAVEAEPPAVVAMPGPDADADGLQRVVRDAVAREVAPLRRDLARFKERARMQDLVAGIGYILGFMGIALWFKTRRRAG